MTSKNLFFNLLKEDFRRRLWTFILASLVFFATFMVAFTMLIQNYVARYSRGSYNFTKAEFVEHISNNICSDFYGFYWWFIVVAIVGAIICGMSGFAYLHSKKQMDFYHSLPVKREMIFAVRFVNGLLIYSVPYLIGLLYTYLICILYGVMTTDILLCSLFFFVLHLMGYMIMYLGTIIAMLLTGKMVIGFFGICAINLYAPGIWALLTSLRSEFFVTAYGSAEDVFLVTRWLSPASYYINTLISLESGEAKLWLEVLLFLVFAAILTVLALVLYKKRASEKADTSMSFKITEPVFRIMLSVPVGILVGMLFYVIQYHNGTGVFWIIFGGLFGGFLAHGIIEALYQGDIRKCLSHKVQMIVCMVVAAITPLLFLYDVFGYDSYLPKKQEVEGMALYSSDLRFAGGYYNEDGWTGGTEYVLKNGKVADIDAMYELAELLVDNAEATRRERFFGDRVTVPYDTENYHSADFTIRYYLKDGSEVTRSYYYNYYAVLDVLADIYNQEEVKKVSHPVFSLIQADFQPIYISCDAPAAGISKQLEENCDTLLQIYAEEMLAMSFEELKNSAPIGELFVHFIIKGDSTYEDASNFLVYPSMTRTIAYLKENGYHMQGIADSNYVDSITVSYSGTMGELKRLLGMEVEGWTEEIDAAEGVKEITGMTYEDHEIYYEKYGLYPETIEVEDWYYEGVSVKITDPAELEMLKQLLVYNSYKSEFGPFPEVENNLRVDVYYEIAKDGDGLEGLLGWTDSYRFKDGQVPEFVKKRLLDKMINGENTEAE